MKDLLRRFLDFFISYGMELGQEPKDSTFTELVQKLQTLSADRREDQNLQIVANLLYDYNLRDSLANPFLLSDRTIF